MATYYPIAFTIPQYDQVNLKNYWLKAYEQGTTTPKVIAVDAAGSTTLAKAELDSSGFPITAGSARFIPHISGAYDLWLFPTSAEADANDTSNAIQLADNINANPAAAGTTKYYDTLAAAITDIANISIGDVIVADGRTTKTDDGGGIWDAVDATTVTENGQNLVTGDASISFSLRESDFVYASVADLVNNGIQWGSVTVHGYHSAGDGGGGEFYWDASQNKANHNGGTIIDPDITFPSDWTNSTQVTTWFTAGTGTGCWIRILDRSVSVKDFGAKEGSTNELLAFNAAIGYINTDNNPQVLRVDGAFTVTGSCDAIIRNHKYIDGREGKITHDNGTLFTWGAGVENGVIYGGIIGLEYLVPDPPTAGTCFIEQSGMNNLLIQGIRSFRTNIFLKAGTTAKAQGYYIRDCRLTTYNGTQTIIDHGLGANSNIQGLDMTASGTERPLDETTATGATATAIKFGSDTWDTAVWSGILINGFLYGLDVNRTVTGKNVSNFRVTNLYIDYSANGIRLQNNATGGGINNMMFVNCWVVGMDGYGVLLGGTVGSHRNITFTNVHALLAGKCNWRLTSTTMDNVLIDSCTGDAANRLNGSNTGSDQDDFVALSGGFTCRNSRFGRTANNIAASGVPNWQARYGFTAPTPAKDWVFENNQVEGVTGAVQGTIASLTVTAGGLYSTSMKGNKVPGGASLPGYATSALITTPTSTALQTNNTPFTYDIHVYGGTVDSIVLNSTEIRASTDATFTVRPGDSWALTWSVSPTVKRIIHP